VADMHYGLGELQLVEKQLTGRLQAVQVEATLWYAKVVV
jgi:hypothetical protein